MSYQTFIQKDLPYAFFSADSVAGARTVQTLVRGEGTAAAVETGDTATYAFTGFSNTHKDKPFALEAWFLPLSTTTSQVFGHAEGDGIVWENGLIKFKVKFSDASTVEVAYEPEQIQTFHVVGQYTKDDITLYVNGEAVGHAVFTETQKALNFVTFSNANQLVTTGDVIIDSFAIYTGYVSAAMASEHWQYGNRHTDIISLTSSFGGGYIELPTFIPTYERTWAGRDWGSLDAGLSVYSDGLAGQAGSVWRANLVVDGSVDVIYLDWDSEGDIDVEYSVNAGAWTAASKLVSVFSGTVSDISVRVTFNDSGARLHWIKAQGNYNVKVGSSFSGRQARIGAADQDLFYPNDNKKLAGNRGQLIVETDPEGANTYAVEFWVRPDSATTVSAVTNFPGTSYVNGVAATALVANEWSHVFINLTAPENVSRNITGSCRIAGVAIYKNTLTAPQVLELYQAYYGKDSLVVTSNDAIELPILTDQFNVYTYEWSIVSAG